MLIDKQITRWVSKPSVLPRRSCKETAHIIKYLQEAAYRPIHAQFIVGSAPLRIGTKIDLICTNDQNDIVLVEIKRGCHYRKATTGNKMIGFEKWTDSCYHQHQLQCLMNMYLFQETIPKTSRVSSLLLYVNDSNVSDAICSSDFEYTSLTSDAKAILQDTIHITRKRKRR